MRPRPARRPAWESGSSRNRLQCTEQSGSQGSHLALTWVHLDDSVAETDAIVESDLGGSLLTSVVARMQLLKSGGLSGGISPRAGG